MDVEASRAIRQAEVGAAKTMIERTEECFGIKPERLAADTAKQDYELPLSTPLICINVRASSSSI